MHYTFQFGVILDRLPELLWGAVLTLELAFAGFWLGLPIALMLAAMRTSASRFARGFSGAYVTFLINTPVLVHIYFLYYGLPEVGILLDKHVAVVIGLITATSAYGCEILRAGFASVRATEIEAASTMGFSRAQQIWHVIVPHIMRTVYPALANYFIILTLSTSMAMIFGVNELLGTAYNLASENYRHIEAFTVAAGIYIVITFVATLSLALIGRWVFHVRARIF
jgi:polar amino acid transport system permease protein